MWDKPLKLCFVKRVVFEIVRSWAGQLNEQTKQICFFTLVFFWEFTPLVDLWWTKQHFSSSFEEGCLPFASCVIGLVCCIVLDCLKSLVDGKCIAFPMAEAGKCNCDIRTCLSLNGDLVGQVVLNRHDWGVAAPAWPEVRAIRRHCVYREHQTCVGWIWKWCWSAHRKKKSALHTRWCCKDVENSDFLWFQSTHVPTCDFLYKSERGGLALESCSRTGAVEAFNANSITLQIFRVGVVIFDWSIPGIVGSFRFKSNPQKFQRLNQTLDARVFGSGGPHMGYGQGQMGRMQQPMPYPPQVRTCSFNLQMDGWSHSLAILVFERLFMKDAFHLPLTAGHFSERNQSLPGSARLCFFPRPWFEVSFSSHCLWSKFGVRIAALHWQMLQRLLRDRTGVEVTSCLCLYVCFPSAALSQFLCCRRGQQASSSSFMLWHTLVRSFKLLYTTVYDCAPQSSQTNWDQWPEWVQSHCRPFGTIK